MHNVRFYHFSPLVGLKNISLKLIYKIISINFADRNREHLPGGNFM